MALLYSKEPEDERSHGLCWGHVVAGSELSSEPPSMWPLRPFSVSLRAAVLGQTQAGR